MKSIMRWVLSLVVTPLISAVPAFAETPGFPETGLAERIAFWEKVFTTYGEEDLIIHDTERVYLIYDVVDEDSRRPGVRRVQGLLDEVRQKVSTPEELSDDARRMYDAIEDAGVRMTAGNIAVLRGRIHVQRGIRERFRDGVVRSGRYIDYFREVMGDHGVPEVLALLPLVESSFENTAYSSAGAAGIWQFTRSTGRQFMRVVRGRDDRLNPTIATQSAARLLRGNYESLGSWPLAISAYNHGRAGMARAKRAHGSNMATIIANYQSRTFGYASKNFYAEFIAAVNVYQNYAHYFGPLALDAPLDFSTPAARMVSTGNVDAGNGVPYRVRSGDTLSTIAARNGTTVGDLMTLNRLPSDRIFAGETILISGVVSGGVGSDGRYEVRWGDTLSDIAHQFGLGLRELMELNNLVSSTIYAGQLLSVR